MGVALPLYAGTPKDLCERIGNQEFVDMKKLSPLSALSPSKDRPSSITSGGRSFLRFISEKARTDPSQVQDLLVHMDTVMALSEDRHQWKAYDQEFSRQQANVG